MAWTWASSWSYWYERKAMVVTVPITEATTAMSETADTTRRVRSDQRFDAVRGAVPGVVRGALRGRRRRTRFQTSAIAMLTLPA